MRTQTNFVLRAVQRPSLPLLGMSWSLTEVSVVAHARETETKSYTLAKILGAIKGGKWASQITALRALVDKDAIREAKEKLPGVMFSGRFSERTKPVLNFLEQSSGILALDADNCTSPVELRNKLTSDPHVVFAFISPYGLGLKVGVRIEEDVDSHKASWAAAKKYFEETYNVKIDEACKDISRLCFVSYDPDAFIREDEAEILEPLASAPVQPDLHTFLVNKCGAPFRVNQQGEVVAFNQSYFSQRFCLETLMLFELEERRFYLYRDSNGAWQGVPAEVVKKQFKEYYEKLCLTIWPGVASQLLPKCTDNFENAIVNNAKAIVGKVKIFKPLKRIVHCANGMLHLDPKTGECVLKSFSPDYYSRNPIPIDWVPEARAPMFSEILKSMPDYDSSLILRYFGNILLTGNAAQSILIMHGEGGTSKSTLCETIELIIGEDNFIEMRTEHLKERFEIGRFIGRTLLTGKDVPGDFLSHSGASYLKKLTGHDNQTGEIKGTMERPTIRGEFAVLITCNERLLVRLEGQKDLSAWKRRLLVIHLTSASKHKEVIDFYAQKMVASEGPGILFMIVQGAMAHLEEIETRAVFHLSPEQEMRVDALLAESQSIEVFLRAKVQKGGKGIATDALCSGYAEYCEEQGWEAMKVEKFRRELANHMFALFGSHPSNNINRDKNTPGVRGYLEVSMK